MPNLHEAAIYLRLSREDHLGADDESESILNQRLMLEQYAAAHGIEIVAEFSDDGVSGIRQQRTGLTALKSAIADGWIHTVLVKDLSRLSRDYIQTGELIERWFPRHGARLIAVNDGIDTANASAANDYSPIRAIMDDWYARDISRKVRSAIYARQQAGICTMAHLPYGYTREASQIKIDTKQAAVVRHIFDLCINHQNCAAISAELTANEIASPGHKNRWNDVTVRRILRNQAYIGRLLLRTTRKAGYKCGKKIYLPERDTLVYPLPALISESEFAAAQETLLHQAHMQCLPMPFRGKMVCGICGSRMHACQGRYLCGGKRRGNGCRNPSLRSDLFQKQLLSAFFERGIEPAPDELSHAIKEIIVFSDKIQVCFYCRQPAGTR